MESKKVKEILREAVKLGISEFSLEKGDCKLAFKKSTHQGDVVLVEQSRIQGENREEVQHFISNNKREIESSKEEDVSTYNHEITSPMVGTFYLSPSPQDPPFVKLGDTIQKGDVVCIIESMKVMNEVKSDCSGKIVEICIENSKPVEFGTRLFLVD